MISGSTRGRGGRNLSAHLLKEEPGQTVRVVKPRGVVTMGNLHEQLDELCVSAKAGRTERPCYHVHVDPPKDAADCQVVLDAWWQAFESEFGLRHHSYVGAQHDKKGRLHEHRIYSLVGPDGRCVDPKNDYPRRTYVSLSVAFALGLEPAPTPHARSCAHRFMKEGRADVIEWMARHDLIEQEKPVAESTPAERLMEVRTGVRLADVRAAAFEAWNASTDGQGLRTELARRGLGLAMGTVGAVIVDRSGTPHALTRIIGAASRMATGERIPAAVVKARVAGLKLEKWNGSAAGRVDLGGPGTQAGNRGPDRDPVARGRADGPGAGARRVPAEHRAGGASAGRRSDERGQPRQFTPRHAARAFARARLSRALAGVDWKAVRSAEHLADQLMHISTRQAGPWIPGRTDIWGVPLP
jgi:hypothetical protein